MGFPRAIFTNPAPVSSVDPMAAEDSAAGLGSPLGQTWSLIRNAVATETDGQLVITEGGAVTGDRLCGAIVTGSRCDVRFADLGSGVGNGAARVGIVVGDPSGFPNNLAGVLVRPELLGIEAINGGGYGTLGAYGTSGGQSLALPTDWRFGARWDAVDGLIYRRWYAGAWHEAQVATAAQVTSALGAAPQKVGIGANVSGQLRSKWAAVVAALAIA